MSREVNHILLEQIKRHEGYRRFPYQDTMGKWTIGIGRNLDDVGISEDEAEYLCMNDLQKCVKYLRTFDWYKDLTLNRRRALINMVFNLGPGGFQKFQKMISAISRGDFVEAEKQALDSLWARQVGYRAREVAEQLRKG